MATNWGSLIILPKPNRVRSVCVLQAEEEMEKQSLASLSPIRDGEKHIFLHTRLSLSFIGGGDGEKIIMGFFRGEKKQSAFLHVVAQAKKTFPSTVCTGRYALCLNDGGKTF